MKKETEIFKELNGRNMKMKCLFIALCEERAGFHILKLHSNKRQNLVEGFGAAYEDMNG